MKTKILLIFCCFIALALTGCGKNLPTPERPQSVALTYEMQQRLEQEMRAYGAGINTYKALGKIMLKKNGKLILSGRAGWSAEYPNKLSLVAFAAGIPVMRMASDGQKIYYADSFHNDNKLVYYVAPNDPDTMYDYLGIYISTANLVGLWMGKVLPSGYSVAGYNEEGGQRVVIMHGTGGDMRYVYLDKQTDSIIRIDDFTKDGGLKYSAFWREMQNVHNSSVPFKMLITNTKDTELEFLLDNVWINEPTNPGMFVLFGDN